MAPNKKYLSLEEAAVQLGVTTDELVRLREKGEVRGFADRGTWKFKADDVAEFRRRRQPDSDPDLPIMDEDFDDDMARQQTVIRRGNDVDSDSDVRLSNDDPRKKRLSGSSADLPAIEQQKSDSDVRLADSGKRPAADSDSDVKLVKPKSAIKSDSDSDVKMFDSLAPESDSDVKLLEPNKSLSDSDSDVRLAASDSDVRLAPLLSSDSDVKLVGKKSKSDSDSDVSLFPTRRSGKTDPMDALDDGPMNLSDGGSALLDGDDSSITLAGDSGIMLEADSGITLEGDSGIRLGGSSGIRLAGDSGIRLADESGVQLKNPADSGISLEGDSGIQLAGDSGISLSGPSSIKGLKGGSSAKGMKGGSSAKGMKGGSSKTKGRRKADDLDATVPMNFANLDDDDDLSKTSPLLSASDSSEGSVADLDLFDASDTSEMASLGDSNPNVVMFDEDEDEAPPKKRPRQRTVEESIFEMDETIDEPLEELEVSDDDLSDESEIDDLAFDDEDADMDDSFTAGSSEFGTSRAQKVMAPQEVEWSTGIFLTLMASLSVLALGAWVSADLLRFVWAQNDQAPIDPFFAGLFGGLWK